MDSLMCEAQTCKCNVCYKYNMVCFHEFGSDLRVNEGWPLSLALFGLSINHVGNFYNTTIHSLK